MNKNIDTLVICSTLNQITNYLIIRKFKPKKIYNITFKDIQSSLNDNIKPKDWDDYLKESIEDHIVDYSPSIEDVEFTTEESIDIKKIKKKINYRIISNIDNEIYWHITGGQRTLALAISNLLLTSNNREKDKILYIEGNTEKLMIHKYNMNIAEAFDQDYSYSDLTLEEAFKLVGFNTKEAGVRSETFKIEGKSKISENSEAYKFYTALYDLMLSDEKYTINIEFDNKPYFYEDTFRNLLIESNKNSSEKKSKENKQKFIDALFEEVKKHNDFSKINYDLKSKEEYDKQYPAGYIFEKITAFQIYSLIKENHKIADMRASVKTYFSDEDNKLGTIDELDIILLTNTGKIINFECKSGGMKSDNAKSHNYTTYRLNGVFGMPILLSPLYEKEKDTEENETVLKECRKAYRSAQRAELKTIFIDEIKNKNKNELEKLLK